MGKVWRVWASAGALAILLLGCAPEAPESVPPAHILERRERWIEGGLAATVQKLASHPRAVACDQTLTPLRLRIARELDLRMDWLSGPAGQTSLGDSTVKDGLVQIGRARLKPTKRDFKPQPTQWSADSWTWQIEEANLAKALKTNAREDWDYLNRRVRGLLYDDERRIVDERDYEFDHHAPAKVRRIRQALSTCARPCEEPRLDSGLRAFLEDSRKFGPVYRAFQMAENPEDREKAFKELQRLVSYTMGYWDFVPEHSVRRTSGGLGLPILVGALAGGETTLRSFLEKVWTQFGLRMNFELLQEAPSGASPYLFLYDPTPNGRAYMYRTRRFIQLYQGNRMSTVAHEVGHVLGFQDFYFTVWNPQTCGYVDESNSADLMSDSVNGSVQRLHVEELRRNYLTAR